MDKYIVILRECPFFVGWVVGNDEHFFSHFLQTLDECLAAKGENIKPIGGKVIFGNIHIKQITAFKGWRHAIPFHRDQLQMFCISTSELLTEER